jgi:hypothetical protein
MPLGLTEHPHRIVEPFLWNLLPDNENEGLFWNPAICSDSRVVARGAHVIDGHRGPSHRFFDYEIS